MTMDEFWPAFLANEYAVRCDTQWQHDQFVGSYENFCGKREQHKYNPPFFYLFHMGNPGIIGGWTGMGSHRYGAIKLTFQDWLAMQEEPTDDISVSNLEEVL